MRFWPITGLLLGAAFTLQGCVAALLPIAAVGVIGKKEVDKARARTRAAETSFIASSQDLASLPEVFVGDAPAEQAIAALPKTNADVETPGAMSALDRLSLSNISNAYLPFARYALSEAEKRSKGGAARSAVLVEQVSLTQPQTMSCGAKPMAALIDLDVAPGTPAEMDIERQNGFAALLEVMRESGIRIVWLAETDERQLKPILDLLREGEEPVLRDTDLMLIGLPGNYRKQEHRWALAQSHCVVAIAGDRKSDFDELYDYLRDQDYAIRLEAFNGRGWFELPHPIAAIDSERLAISPDKKASE
ncbi:MAG: hypothetical protein ABL928_12670 [Sphingorhabdus sp.]